MCLQLCIVREVSSQTTEAPLYWLNPSGPSGIIYICFSANCLSDQLPPEKLEFSDAGC